ncbi:hypothetical protein [Rhizobium leguminosarum]|uniref:hypothetical protein n=1 Tax=Rhizobium leguminosarum TaxID=384 RepID=UPI001030C3BF|nr:hypothetical protein [Rhizobium leguminosarum]TAV72616.1 hypothetical protein ELI28_03360 [Rhizobium leguminosarum]TAV77217.1 hypothetical protein ELI27_03360 [Rhizobium leguminosarum]TAZ28964.1 hypothetical protein ELH73_03365 [Rhizobium leguminosarum]
MADFDFSRDTEDARVLTIAFTGEKPLGAAEVATVLRALDTDYRALNGRGLVLGRLEIGSTWFSLYDALVAVGGVAGSIAEIAKAIDDISSFGVKLANALKPKPPAAAETGIADVARSVKEMAKVSRKTKSGIKVRKTLTTNGSVETLDIDITPVEAIAASKVASQKLKATTRTTKDTLEAYHGELLGAVRQISGSTIDPSLISALVRALMIYGGVSSVQMVASALESEGRGDVAAAIRQEIDKGRGQVTIQRE